MPCSITLPSVPRATVSSSQYLCVLSALGLIYFWQVTIPRLQEASCKLGLSNNNIQELRKPVYLVITTPILQSLEGLLGCHWNPGIFLEFQPIPFSLVRRGGGDEQVSLWMVLLHFAKRAHDAHVPEICMRQVWEPGAACRAWRASSLATARSLRGHHSSPCFCCSLLICLKWAPDSDDELCYCFLWIHLWTIHFSRDAFWIRCSCRFTWKISTYI